MAPSGEVVKLAYPAEEDTEDADDYVYVSPPYVEQYMPMGAEAYAGVAAWPSFVYGKVGGVADRDQLWGAAADVKPSSLIKEGSGMTNSDANGTYGVVVLGYNVGFDGSRSYFVGHLPVTLNGAGTVAASGVLTQVSLDRLVGGGGAVSLRGVAATANITGGSYSVGGTGALTLNITADTAAIPQLSGHANDAGTFFFAGATEHLAAGADPEQVTNMATFGVKVGTAAPVVAGKSYRFESCNLEYGDGGPTPGYVYGNHVASSTISFTAPDEVSLSLNMQYVDRPSDITSINAASEFNQVESGTYATAANGVITITLANGSVINGYVSADNNAFVAVHRHGTFSATPATVSEGGLGIAFGSCSSGCE